MKYDDELRTALDYIRADISATKHLLSFLPQDDVVNRSGLSNMLEILLQEEKQELGRMEATGRNE